VESSYRPARDSTTASPSTTAIVCGSLVTTEPHRRRPRDSSFTQRERAAFARCRGSHRLFLDRLICVYGFFELAVSAELSRLTMLGAVEYGWWYAARLPESRVAVAVASDAELIKNSDLRSPRDWLACLARTNHLADFLVDCRFIPCSLLICAAPLFVMDSPTGDRWLAVGDAASAYDPISAQGIYKSLRDGLEAAESIVAFRERAASRLQAYRTGIATRIDGYLNVRNYFYGLKQRWPSSPFWTRRQQSTMLGAFSPSACVV
jgi:hypothetical protein